MKIKLRIKKEKEKINIQKIENKKIKKKMARMGIEPREGLSLEVTSSCLEAIFIPKA